MNLPKKTTFCYIVNLNIFDILCFAGGGAYLRFLKAERELRPYTGTPPPFIKNITFTLFYIILDCLVP